MPRSMLPRGMCNNLNNAQFGIPQRRPANPPYSALPTEITRMNAEQQSNRERPRLEIDEKLGFILAVVAGALLSIAAGGWMILLSNITQLKSTFDAGEAQRFAQLGIMEGTIRIIQDKIEILTGSNGKIRMLEDKIDSATDKFRQMEAALKQSRDEASKSNIRLNKIEEDLSKARRRIPLSNSKASETPEARERR